MAIRDRRAQLGLSQQELADRADVSRRWLVKVEAGHPGAETGAVMRLLCALGLLVDIGSPDEPSDAGGPSPVDLDALLGNLAPKRTRAGG